MKYIKIFKKIHEVGFDKFHQAGSPSRYHKMNIVAESKLLNKRFWICIDSGCGKDTFFIEHGSLNNTSAKHERIYVKNQDGIVRQLDLLQKEIMVKKNDIEESA